ncbi:MAG: hypothetical protein LIP09_09825 [Bacteroidales bacterium]|nr:hypothetical protein [Bacteroidales bacterium]
MNKDALDNIKWQELPESSKFIWLYLSKRRNQKLDRIVADTKFEKEAVQSCLDSMERLSMITHSGNDNFPKYDINPFVKFDTSILIKNPTQIGEPTHEIDIESIKEGDEIPEGLTPEQQEAIIERWLSESETKEYEEVIDESAQEESSNKETEPETIPEPKPDLIDEMPEDELTDAKKELESIRKQILIKNNDQVWLIKCLRDLENKKKKLTDEITALEKDIEKKKLVAIPNPKGLRGWLTKKLSISEWESANILLNTQLELADAKRRIEYQKKTIEEDRSGAINAVEERLRQFTNAISNHANIPGITKVELDKLLDIKLSQWSEVWTDEAYQIAIATVSGAKQLPPKIDLDQPLKHYLWDMPVYWAKRILQSTTLKVAVWVSLLTLLIGALLGLKQTTQSYMQSEAERMRLENILSTLENS